MSPTCHAVASMFKTIPLRARQKCLFEPPSQSLRCPHEGSLGPWPPIKSTAKTDQTTAKTDAQSDLSLRWAHTHFVGFVMSRLICALSCV